MSKEASVPDPKIMGIGPMKIIMPVLVELVWLSNAAEATVIIPRRIRVNPMIRMMFMSLPDVSEPAWIRFCRC
jgi:hypothetical protein